MAWPYRSIEEKTARFGPASMEVAILSILTGMQQGTGSDREVQSTAAAGGLSGCIVFVSSPSLPVPLNLTRSDVSYRANCSCKFQEIGWLRPRQPKTANSAVIGRYSPLSFLYGPGGQSASFLISPFLVSPAILYKAENVKTGMNSGMNSITLQPHVPCQFLYLICMSSFIWDMDTKGDIHCT